MARRGAPDASAGSSAAVGYSPLGATYDQFDADTDEGGCLTKIDIVSLDEKTGEVTANVTDARQSIPTMPPLPLCEALPTILMSRSMPP